MKQYLFTCEIPGLMFVEVELADDPLVVLPGLWWRRSDPVVQIPSDQFFVRRVESEPHWNRHIAAVIVVVAHLVDLVGRDRFERRGSVCCIRKIRNHQAVHYSNKC